MNSERYCMSWEISLYETDIATKQVIEDKWEILFNINGGVQRVVTAHKSWINWKEQCLMFPSSECQESEAYEAIQRDMYHVHEKRKDSVIWNSSLQYICVIRGLQWKRLNNQEILGEIHRHCYDMNRNNFQWDVLKIHQWWLSKT